MSDATRVPQFPVRPGKPGLDDYVDPIHPSVQEHSATEEVASDREGNLINDDTPVETSEPTD